MRLEDINTFMKEALKEAEIASFNNEIPVGAVIVDLKTNKIISKSHNSREKDNNILGHAEINAINDSINKLNTKNLNNCAIFVTLEPCMMCLGAINEAHIKHIYVSLLNDKISPNERRLLSEFLFRNDISIQFSILENESKELLQLFMKKMR